MTRAAFAAACALLALAARPAAAQTGERVLVAAQDGAAVWVLDAATGAVLDTVDLEALGLGATARPHHVVAEPDGSHWYVSLIGAGLVLKLDAEHRVVGQVEMETPGMLALDPAGTLLYASRSMTAVRPAPRLGVIDRSTMTIEEVDVLMPHPHALAVDAGGRRVVTSSLTENRLAWLPVATEDVGHVPFSGPMHMLVQLAVSPDGRWLAGGGEMSGELLVWDLAGEEPAYRTAVALGGKPWDPVFLPDGSELWVPNLGAGSVVAVETAGWTVAAEVRHPALVEPSGSAASADGRTVFVSSRSTSSWGDGSGGALVAIDVASRSVRWATPVGPYAAGVAVLPGRPRR